MATKKKAAPKPKRIIDLEREELRDLLFMRLRQMFFDIADRVPMVQFDESLDLLFAACVSAARDRGYTFEHIETHLRATLKEYRATGRPPVKIYQ